MHLNAIRVQVFFYHVDVEKCYFVYQNLVEIVLSPLYYVVKPLCTGPERNCSHFEFCIIQDIKYQKVKKLFLLDYFQKFSGFFLFFPAYHDIQHNNHTKYDSALLLLENPTHLNVLELTNKI